MPTDREWPNDHPGIVVETPDGFVAIPLWGCGPDGGTDPWKNDEPGAVVQAIDDHMAVRLKDPCCGAPNPCDPDPEMLLTVTGSSGTVNWCGQTWNLPADSGVEKSVCPTAYLKQKYFTSLGGYGSEYHATHEWYFSNSLRLGFHYWIWLFSGTNQWFRDGFQNNDHHIRLGVTGGPFIDRLGVEGTNQPKPRPVFGSFLPTSAYGQLDMGILSTGMPTQTYNNYGITGQWFGSHTVGGITYAWAKGAGWP